MNIDGRVNVKFSFSRELWTSNRHVFNNNKPNGPGLMTMTDFFCLMIFVTLMSGAPDWAGQWSGRLCWSEALGWPQRGCWPRWRPSHCVCCPCGHSWGISMLFCKFFWNSDLKLYLDKKLYLAVFEMKGELPDIITALSLSLKMVWDFNLIY